MCHMASSRIPMSDGIVRHVEKETTKSEVYVRLAEVAKTLTNGLRLEILELLAQCEEPVEALARLTGSTMSTTSANLQVLRRNGLVSTRRAGTTIFYSLAGPDVAELVVCLKSVAVAHSSQARELWRAHTSDGRTVPAADVTRGLETANEPWFVLDVRPNAEYAAGHFPGAVSIPLGELTDRAEEVPTDQMVVVYCRGEFCVQARDAARFLRSRGVDAAAMDEGVLEWRASGSVALDVTA